MNRLCIISINLLVIKYLPNFNVIFSILTKYSQKEKYEGLGREMGHSVVRVGWGVKGCCISMQDL